MISQGKKFSLAILGIIAACCAMTSVMAAVPLPSGWYLEGNIGSARSSDKNYPGTTVDKTGWGWNGNVGYKFMPFFGAEVGYTKYATVKVKNSLGNQAAKDALSSADIAARGIWPICNSGVELFAKLGVARLVSNEQVNASAAAVDGLTFSSGTHTHNGYYIGFGADYVFMPNAFVNIQAASAISNNNNTGNLTLYSLGVAYLFG